MTPQQRDLPRSIGVWGGAALMMGIMIGSGIFRTPTSIADELGSPWLMLAFWAMGGAISLCGALTYAELGTMYPHAGGLYVFLHRGLGPAVAFTFGWTYLFITQPLASAGIATVFSEHLTTLLGREYVDERVVTCALILLLAGLNTTGLKRGAALAVVLTGFKAAALAAIVAVALAVGEGSAANFAAVESPKPLLAALVPVFTAILWTYDGWSDSAAVAEEIREPQKRLPRVFLLGTLVVTGLYLAINAVYLWLIPLPELRASETVAPLVMKRLLGEAGATAVTVMIMVSVLGAVHASMICGARVTFAQARDRLFFAFPAAVHPKFGTPWVALWLQAVLACVAVLGFGTFERITDGFIFTSWIFYGLAGAALFVLRASRPDAERPYRCWGHPVVPGLFVLAAGAMTVISIVDAPVKSGLWLLVLVAGLPAYELWKRFRPAPLEPGEPPPR